jgi:hypothetical protein
VTKPKAQRQSRLSGLGSKTPEPQTLVTAVASFKPVIRGYDKDFKGQIRIMLYQDKAPISVANFWLMSAIAALQRYDFHRVIQDL